MIVVGIDPGLAACGVAVLFREDERNVSWSAWTVRTIRTKASEPLHRRLQPIWEAILAGTGNAVESTIIACEHNAHVLAGEGKAGATNADAALVQTVIGVAHAVALQTKTPFVYVTPAEAKRVFPGIRRTASKAQVQRAIRALVRGLPDVMSEHASDAVANAVAGASKYHVESMARRWPE